MLINTFWSFFSPTHTVLTLFCKFYEKSAINDSNLKVILASNEHLNNLYKIVQFFSKEFV